MATETGQRLSAAEEAERRAGENDDREWEVELQKVNLQQTEVDLHKRQVELQERETELRQQEIDLLQTQAHSQRRASVLQRWSTTASVLIGIGSVAVAIFLGLAQFQMQKAQVKIAESQEELASIGLKTSTSQAQAELILALSDPAKRTQAAYALAQFGENAILPLCLTLHTKDDKELLAAAAEALVSVYDLTLQEHLLRGQEDHLNSQAPESDSQDTAADLQELRRRDDEFDAFVNKFDRALESALTRLWDKNPEHPGITTAAQVMLRTGRIDVFTKLLGDNSSDDLSGVLVLSLEKIVEPEQLGDGAATEARRALLKLVEDDGFRQEQRSTIMNALLKLTSRDEEDRKELANALIDLSSSKHAGFDQLSMETVGPKIEIAKIVMHGMIEILEDQIMKIDPSLSSSIKSRLLIVLENRELDPALRVFVLTSLKDDQEVESKLQRIANDDSEDFLVKFTAQDVLETKKSAVKEE